MITFSALGSSSTRMTNGSVGVTVYADAPAQADDILVQSVPQEVPEMKVICWPGEYDIHGITLRGIPHEEGRQTSFLIVVDGIRCAFPSLPLKEWTEIEFQQAGDVDVLVVPSTEPKGIQTLVDELDPRVLIILPGDGAAHAELIRALGAQDKEVMSEYKLKALPQDGREVVVLMK